MGTVVEVKDFSNPIIRRKALSAKNGATLATTADFGELGSCTMYEPVAHGGTGLGPSPLQVVLGAFCACESVTFGRTATGMGFSYRCIAFDAAYSIDVRGRQRAALFRTFKVRKLRRGCSQTKAPSDFKR